MANPTAEAVATIQAKISDWGPTNQELAAALNEELVANPVTEPPKTPRQLEVSAVLELLTTSLGNLWGTPGLGEIRDDIRAQDRDGVAHWATLASAAPAGKGITAEERDAILAHLQETVDDPEWTAEIPWSVAHLGRRVDARDIAAARPEGGS